MGHTRSEAPPFVEQSEWHPSKDRSGVCSSVNGRRLVSNRKSEPPAPSCGSEQRQAAIATPGDEVQMAQVVIVLEVLGHQNRTKKQTLRPPFGGAKGWGTPAAPAASRGARSEHKVGAVARARI